MRGLKRVTGVIVGCFLSAFIVWPLAGVLLSTVALRLVATKSKPGLPLMPIIYVGDVIAAVVTGVILGLIVWWIGRHLWDALWAAAGMVAVQAWMELAFVSKMPWEAYGGSETVARHYLVFTSLELLVGCAIGIALVALGFSLWSRRRAGAQ